MLFFTHVKSKRWIKKGIKTKVIYTLHSNIGINDFTEFQFISLNFTPQKFEVCIQSVKQWN